jgi:hypothetical protein
MKLTLLLHCIVRLFLHKWQICIYNNNWDDYSQISIRHVTFASGYTVHKVGRLGLTYLSAEQCKSISEA